MTSNSVTEYCILTVLYSVDRHIGKIITAIYDFFSDKSGIFTKNCSPRICKPAMAMQMQGLRYSGMTTCVSRKSKVILCLDDFGYSVEYLVDGTGSVN